MTRGRYVNLVMINCTHKGKRELTDGCFVITSEYHLALEQVDLKGIRVTQQLRIENGN